ncbi:MAG: hypothetical protein ACOH2T_27995 [Pseudomonas sp.]
MPSSSYQERGGFNSLITTAIVAGTLFATGGSAWGFSGTNLNPANTTRLTFLQGSREGSIGESVTDHILSELGRLPSGWAGAETFAPSDAVLSDIAVVLATLNLQDSTIPEVHVDDDGSTSLIWALDGDRLVSLEFFGKGYVACTFAHSDPAQSRVIKIDANDDIAIARFFEDIYSVEA